MQFVAQQQPLMYGQAAHIGMQAWEAPGVAAARYTKAFLAAGGNWLGRHRRSSNVSR